VSALTSDERRRVFVASQEATLKALARLSAPVAASPTNRFELRPLTSIEQMLPRV
jgi:hypothetical protein